MKRVVVVLLLASCLVVTVERSAHACTCIPLTDPEQVLQRSDGAFVGSFVGSSNDKTSKSWPFANYEFKVDAVYKGTIASEVVVRAGRDSAGCGIAARPGDRVGLFLERDKGVWTSSSCSQVSAADMQLTNVRPSVPIDGEEIPPLAEGANAFPVEALWALAAAMMLLTVALMMARHRPIPG